MRYVIPLVVLFAACGAPEPKILLECPREMSGAPPPAVVTPVAACVCEPSARGEEGATGAPGQAGEQGPQGSPGEMGPRGATGAPGAPGTQGPQGLIGPMGNRGPQGFPGQLGAPGAMGLKGDPGRDSTLTNWTFAKAGNNGTVSCDTYCGGAQWGRVGTCIGAKVFAGARAGDYLHCAIIPGEGNWLRCACTNFD